MANIEVILVKDVANLGSACDTVYVKPGYARNCLVPQGHAVYSTESSKKMVEERKQELKAEEDKKVAEANSVAEQLRSLKIRFEENFGNDGKMYGSINDAYLVKYLKSKGYDITVSMIKFSQGSVRLAGTYNFSVVLHARVIVDLTFEVIDKSGRSAEDEEMLAIFAKRDEKLKAKALRKAASGESGEEGVSLEGVELSSGEEDLVAESEEEDVVDTEGDSVDLTGDTEVSSDGEAKEEA